MTRSARRVTLALLFSLIMLTSMIGPFVGVAAATSATSNQPGSTAAIEPTTTPASHEISTVNITEEFAVWERAPLRPAKVDRSGAATTVDSPTVNLEGETGDGREIVTISTDQEVVFDQGTTVDFEFAADSVPASLPDNEFKVLVARIDADRDTTEVFLDAQNVTVSEVERALEDVDGYDEFNQTVQDQEEVRFGTVRDFFEGTNEFEQFATSFAENQTITTDRVRTALTSEEFLNNTSFNSTDGGDISSSGQATAQITLDEAGTYLLVGHIGGEVYKDGDDRPRFNDTTALSVDAVTAQEAGSDITVSTADGEVESGGEVEAGDNVSVAATANLDTDANVSHAVAVFDEETLSGTTTEVIVDDEFSRDLRTENVTVNSTLAEIQGVANVQPNVAISGTEIASERFNGTVSATEQASSFFDIRNALVDGFDIRDQTGDAAEFNTIDDTTLNASMTAVGNATGTETLTVETLQTWKPGTYTVLHVASDQRDGNVSTTRQTIQIVDEIDTGDGGDGSEDDDGSGDEDGDDGGGGPVGGGGGGGGIGPTDPPAPSVNVIERDQGASVTVENIPANVPTRFGVGRSVSVNGVSVRNFTVNLVRDRPRFDLDVDTSQSPPGDVTQVGTGQAFSYVDVDAGDLTDDDYNSVEWEFSIDPDRLEENDREPENVQLQRYNEADGEWEQYETTYQGDGEFVATVPGFSTFAITAVQPATFTVTDASLSSTEVEVDEPFELDATIENEGDETGTTTVEVLVDDSVVETRDIILQPGATYEETFELSIAEEGDFEVRVDETSAGEVSVTAVEGPDGSDGSDGGDGDDGSPIGIALAFILIAFLVGGGVAWYLRETSQ